jgi:succinate dehydrogenase / fumarate reductase cytochrome b subunit
VGVIHGKKCEKTKTCQSGSTNDTVPNHGDSVHSPSRFRCHHLRGGRNSALAAGHQPSSPEGFLTAASIMDSFFVKFIMWGILTALAYHVVVGIRHLMMDFGYLDETLEAGKRSAKISLLLLSCFHFSQESSYGKQRLSTGTQRRT